MIRLTGPSLDGFSVGDLTDDPVWVTITGRQAEMFVLPTWRWLQTLLAAREESAWHQASWCPQGHITHPVGSVTSVSGSSVDNILIAYRI